MAIDNLSVEFFSQEISAFGSQFSLLLMNCVFRSSFRYHLIVRYYLKIGDYNSLTETCKRLGKMQPSLWLQALTGLRDNKNAPPNLLSQVLEVIGKDK